LKVIFIPKSHPEDTSEGSAQLGRCENSEIGLGVE